VDARTAKGCIRWLVNTPFHPQWLLARTNRKYFQQLGRFLSGRVLDIGCGHQAIRQFLQQNCDYTGMDNYATAVEWYGSKPDIYAMADYLPFPDKSFDSVLLLDVLEHVPSTLATMQEVNRVLKTGGRVFIQLPFLYPVHDAPLDFYRWTEFGLEKLCNISGFDTEQTDTLGTPLQTAVLLMNLALCKSLINAWNRKNPVFLFVILLPVIIPVFNLLALLLARITPADRFMPYRYRLSAIKKTDKSA